MNNEPDNVQTVAVQISTALSLMVNDDQISPPEVLVGALRGATAFWMGCLQEGARVDGLNILRQAVNEEIDGMIRGMANGMVPT